MPAIMMIGDLVDDAGNGDTAREAIFTAWPKSAYNFVKRKVENMTQHGEVGALQYRRNLRTIPPKVS